MITELKQM